MFLVGSVESHTILRSYTILHDPMYDPSAILIVLVRWDRKIVRFYDPDRDFDNHGWGTKDNLMPRKLMQYPHQHLFYRNWFWEKMCNFGHSLSMYRMDVNFIYVTITFANNGWSFLLLCCLIRGCQNRDLDRRIVRFYDLTSSKRLGSY